MSVRAKDKLGVWHWRDLKTGRFIKAPAPQFCWRYTYGLMFAVHGKYYSFIGQVWCKEKDDGRAQVVRERVVDEVNGRSYMSQEDMIEAEGWQEVPYFDGEEEGFGRVQTREEWRTKAQWNRK